MSAAALKLYEQYRAFLHAPGDPEVAHSLLGKKARFIQQQTAIVHCRASERRQPRQRWLGVESTARSGCGA